MTINCKTGAKDISITKEPEKYLLHEFLFSELVSEITRKGSGYYIRKGAQKETTKNMASIGKPKLLETVRCKRKKESSMKNYVLNVNNECFSVSGVSG